MMKLSRAILLGIPAVLVASACGAPQGQPLSAGAPQEESCDLEQAHQLVYGTPLDDDFPPDQYTWLCDKALAALEEAEAREAGDANPAPVPPNPEEAGPTPEPDFYQEAIIGGEQLMQEDITPLIEARGDFNTLWRGVVDKSNVRVWAGSAVEDSHQGIIHVELVDPVTGEVLDRESLETPIPGPVRIETAEGPLLTLRSNADDSLVQFDAETRTFEGP